MNTTAMRQPYNELLVEMFRNYSDLISGQFYGHTHRDSLMVLLGRQGNVAQPVDWRASSFSPLDLDSSIQGLSSANPQSKVSSWLGKLCLCEMGEKGRKKRKKNSVWLINSESEFSSQLSLQENLDRSPLFKKASQQLVDCMCRM